MNDVYKAFKESRNSEDHLEHYGVMGMKWGIRRYENKDGSLTELGKKHYAKTGEEGYHYKSHATKKWDRKSARQEAKGTMEKAARYKRIADRSRAMDEKEEEYARSVSTGKTLLTRAFLDHQMSKAAQQNLAIASLLTGRDVSDRALRSRTRGKAYCQNFLASFGSANATALSRAEKSDYIRERGAYSAKHIEKTRAKLNSKLDKWDERHNRNRANA